MDTSFHRLFVSALLLAALPCFALTHYVDVNSTNPVPPYTNWVTAANVIQDAVDAAATNDTVLVTNGEYSVGARAGFGTLLNRVVVDRAITLQSVNGPDSTIITGSGQVAHNALRCVYLVNGASLIGFTLTNGATKIIPYALSDVNGGGLFCESQSCIVSNCVLVSNASHQAGGGAYQGTLLRCVIEQNTSGSGGGGVIGGLLQDCIVKGNTANGDGGGASSCDLNNCTVVGNTAQGVGGYGGGTYASLVTNSIVYFNFGPAPNHMRSDMHACCTIPAPSGFWDAGGNITNAPLFVDTNGWADLRLQSNSPCINAGNHAYVTTTNDLGGNPRIVGGAVDMGAYEFQSPQSSISYAYLQQYGLPTDGSVDDEDGDNDKATTWQEWKAWTIPTNQLSVLRMLNPDPQTNGTEVSWQSVTAHSYTLERATNGAANFTQLQSGIAGQAGTTTFTDTTATNSDAFFYRVGVPE